MGARELVLGVALIFLAVCATAPAPAKPRALTPAERDSLSQTLDPLLTAAGLWRGPADGCAADFGVVEGDLVAVGLMPLAPCRVRLVLTEGTLAGLDRATLRGSCGRARTRSPRSGSRRLSGRALVRRRHDRSEWWLCETEPGILRAGVVPVDGAWSHALTLAVGRPAQTWHGPV